MKRIFFLAALILFLGGCAGNRGHQALKRGMRALEKGKYTESISWFQRSLTNIASNGERSIALNCMGISYHKLGQKENALRAFEGALSASPGAPEPIYNMGLVAFEAGDEDKGFSCFEKAALLSKEACPGSAWDTRALEFMAVIYTRRQQWDDARRVLNEASGYTHHPSRILTAQAATEVKAGNINQALELLQEALERDAHYAPAIYNLALINQRYLHKHDQALPLFIEYARLVPAGPQTDQARLIIEEMKNTRAPLSPPATAPSAATPSPSSPQLPAPTRATAERTAAFPSFKELMQVAEKLEQQGRTEAAFNNYLRIARAAERSAKTSIRNQALRHAVALADGNPQVAYDLGVYFEERDQKDEAFLYFKAAMNQDINLHSAAMALAKLALEKGEYDTAIVSLKKADQIKPDDPEALWLLAGLYDRYLGLSNSAVAAYTSFEARFPDNRRTPAALSRLKAMNAEFKPSEKVSSGKNINSLSLWQRMFKSSVTN